MLSNFRSENYPYIISYIRRVADIYLYLVSYIRWSKRDKGEELKINLWFKFLRYLRLNGSFNILNPFSSEFGAYFLKLFSLLM